MSLLEQLFAIARNTLLESIRQPIVLVVCVAATILVVMSNPFSVRWLAGWTFQTVLMEGNVQVEAHGFGICLRTPTLPGESPVVAADRLVLAEDQRRRAQIGRAHV